MPMANVYNRRLGFKDPKGGDFSLYSHGVIGGVDLLLHREVADPFQLCLVGRQLQCGVRAVGVLRLWLASANL